MNIENVAEVPLDRLLEYKDEALSKGLELNRVSRVDGVLFGDYKRLSCNHISFRQISSVRHNKSSHCLDCSTEELVKACAIKNMEFLGTSSDGSNMKRSFKFLSCGHIADIHYGNVLKIRVSRDVICRTCFNEEYEKDKLRLNVTEIEPDKSKIKAKNRVDNYGAYRFNSCGHVFYSLRYNLKDCNNSCSECKHEAFLKIVESRNLLWNGKSTNQELNSRYSNYTFKSCGHSRDIDDICIVRNNFRCIECNDSFMNQPSNIYLFQIKTDNLVFLKLGYGKNVHNRIREYGLKEGTTTELLYSKPIVDGKIAMKLENKIHKDLIGRRLQPLQMKKYFTRTGHTECYPIDMLVELTEILIKT